MENRLARCKEGAIVGLFIIAAISIAIIIFFGAWIFAMNIVEDKLVNINTGVDAKVNVSEAATLYFVPVNRAYQFLRLIAFTMLFGLSIAFILTNFLIRAHPYLYVVYVLVTMVAVIFSVYISNAYESLLTNNALSSTFASFTAANFIMSNLPLWIGTVGLIGAIVLFININRDGGLSADL